MARSAIRSLVNHEKVPKSTLPLLQGLNSHLCGGIPKGMFMTVNLLMWDADQKKIKYTSAGHEHLLVYRAATKQVEKIKAGGTATGVLKQTNAMMKEKDLPLALGDQLLLYTDGVSEAMNEKHKEFGLDTVVGLVQKHGHLAPKALCDEILKAIIAFRGEADPHDDITLVALRASNVMAPPPPAPPPAKK
jgi:sigma-B regulation protein RsbU (phosphoserine phosphatase)